MFDQVSKLQIEDLERMESIESALNLHPVIEKNVDETEAIEDEILGEDQIDLSQTDELTEDITEEDSSQVRQHKRYWEGL